MVSTGIGVRQGVNGWDGVESESIGGRSGTGATVRVCGACGAGPMAYTRSPRTQDTITTTYLRYATPARSHVLGTRSAHRLMMARILFATMNSMSCDDSASPMNTPSFSFDAMRH